MVFRLLTERQGEFLRLHCAGKSLEEIATALGTSLGTSRWLRQSVKNRLRNASMDEICRMAEAGESPAAVLKKPVAVPLTPGPTDKVKRDSTDSEHPPRRRYPTGD